MADFTYNIAKGAVVEKVRDGASNIGLLLLEAAEADDALKDHADLAALLGAAGNTEMADASYARKTGLTGTIEIDNTNNWIDVTVPDQTFSALNGNPTTDAVYFYDEGGTDATRIPLTNHDFAVTPDGTDVTVDNNAEGIHRAQD